MSKRDEPSIGAVVVMFVMIFGIMGVILHDLAESVATDVVRHNAVSFLCPPNN